MGMVQHNDHDLLISISTKMESIKEKFEAGTRRMDKIEVKLDDMHLVVDGIRMRNAKVWGIAIGGSSVLTLLINWVVRMV